jgi:hypothetical protein
MSESTNESIREIIAKQEYKMGQWQPGITEAAWLSSGETGPLLRAIAPIASDRKLHLYAIACCHRIAPLLPHPDSRRGIEVLEEFVEGRATSEEVNEINWYVEGAAFRLEGIARREDWQVEEWIRETERIPQKVLADLINNPGRPIQAVRELLISAAYFADSVVSTVPWERRMIDHLDMIENRNFQFAPFLCDIFGNPFRPVAFNPRWQSTTAVGLAQSMYESRDFGAMPILADALQDAGCEDDAILSHCRDPKQPHVRGCWVVDLVLGKS